MAADNGKSVEQQLKDVQAQLKEADKKLEDETKRADDAEASLKTLQAQLEATQQFDPQESAMPVEEVAKLVKREVIVPGEGDKKATVKQVAVKPEEIFSFSDYGDHVVVVTNDGKKLVGDK